ncbi:MULTISPECIES: hypothetical protein [Lactobacillus]|uniref:Uncharacterized protein n=1 Tax=Lactobacillus xujianguonis TaxID=2495899 RepID=A0A437STE1_9LACO|nr:MULTISPECIES: hypothetical protein [Lactobacillus]RVU70165.1 hypothetical protein EJK17_09030 [Lactobacillus xujianguonis]RVU73530.1 hypothetical protein EJK20_07810 [Lactobacillus xujianguonis]
MSFYMSFKSMLDSFGVDLTVYPHDKSKPSYRYLGGRKIPVEGTTAPEPIKVHEPVVPANQFSAILSSYVDGGNLEEYDLLWFSSGKYAIDTVIQVPSQGNRKYKVVDMSDWQGYSDVCIYMLKGDAEHPNGL